MEVNRIPGKIRIYKSATIQVGNTDTTVWTVTDGRVFYLEGIILTETGASNATVDIYDGPSSGGVRPLAPIIVPAGSTKEIGETITRGAIPFKNSVVMVSSTGTTWVTIVGYEE